MLKRALKHTRLGKHMGERREALEAANAQTGIETPSRSYSALRLSNTLEAANAQTGIETCLSRLRPTARG